MALMELDIDMQELGRLCQSVDVADLLDGYSEATLPGNPENAGAELATIICGMCDESRDRIVRLVRCLSWELDHRAMSS